MILKANIKMFIKWIWTQRRVILNKYSIVFHYSIWVCSQGIWNLFLTKDGGPHCTPGRSTGKGRMKGSILQNVVNKAKIKITCRSKRGWDHEPAQGVWKPLHWARQQKWKPGNRARRQSDKKNKARSSGDKIYRKSHPGLILGIRTQGT